MKGCEAIAEARQEQDAVFSGYPITCRTRYRILREECPKWAVHSFRASEVASVNMLYGAVDGDRRPCAHRRAQARLTAKEYRSAPARVPIVYVNVVRGRPGDRSDPACARQDYFQATKARRAVGGFRMIVLAPPTVQECCRHGSRRSTWWPEIRTLYRTHRRVVGTMMEPVVLLRRCS